FVDIIPSATPIVFNEDPLLGNWTVFQQGTVGIPGIINELGAVTNNFAPLGNDIFELASMIFRATTVTPVDSFGVPVPARIQLDPADVSPEHDSLVHEPVTETGSQVVEHKIINFDTAMLIVEALSAGEGDGGEGELLDISGDGVVSPLDALQIINDLNTYGARAITPDAEGEIATPNRRLDVNNDNFISPVDALAVITYLNNHSSVTMPTGEGEAPADVVDLLAADQFKVAVPVSTVADSDSADVVATSSQAPVVVDQPRQVQASSLDLGRWMSSNSDADEAGQEDLESLIDSLADDVSSQWNG
ncbi:MAG: dockerin type I domain-containing protein, partial [Pirellulaceae bacterium]